MRAWLVGFLCAGAAAGAALAGAAQDCASKSGDEAITACTEAIRNDPQVALLYSERGDIYRGKGDLDRAIADYTKAIELDPKYTLAYYNRGLAYMAKSDFDRAIAYDTKVIDIDPKYANAYYSRAAIYETIKGDKSRAIADYRTYLTIVPDDEEAQESLARLGGSPAH